MKTTINNLILVAGIIITAIILGSAVKNRNKTTNVITVTGLGKKDFVSDLIVWNGSFSKKNYDLKAAYEQLDKDRTIIRDYLLKKGVNEKEIVFSSVNLIRDFDYSYDKEGIQHSTFTGYNLTQNVQIESNEVDKIENLSREVTELINMGVELYSQSPEYYYTKLAELKIEMIAAATQDARTRALEIAKNAGSDLGDLKSAGMGVFQIIAQNSSEDFSWGGTFNTYSKEKTATITMKLQYGIK